MNEQPDRYVEITLKPDGTIMIVPVGFSPDEGPSCYAATRPFEEALGRVTTDVPLPPPDPLQAGIGPVLGHTAGLKRVDFKM